MMAGRGERWDWTAGVVVILLAAVTVVQASNGEWERAYKLMTVACLISIARVLYARRRR